METTTRMLTSHASQRDWLRMHQGTDEYVDAMHRFGAAREKLIGKRFSEAFVQHRGHGYPEDDLLLQILWWHPVAAAPDQLRIVSRQE